MMVVDAAVTVFRLDLTRVVRDLHGSGIAAPGADGQSKPRSARDWTARSRGPHRALFNRL